MITLDLVSKHLEGKNSGNSPSGVSCFFVPLNEDWGVKVFHSESKRDYAYANQKEAYERFGLAPAVGDTFDLPDDNYCYITERATPIADDKEMKDLYEAVGEDAYFDAVDKIYEEYSDQMYEVSRTFWNEGFYWSDDHIFNWGVLKDGRLVPIDFGNGR